ncbi:hypothetical protein ABL78_4617 [Leptomonas seymouri]|uniref:Uncharacterized protein n=1 Tax=Leptomonas seymouri TaxID=5684 RepID=A0A0N1PC26_LEPSE|nr:hypothetical protein ABL78_4617 [Leptomonas seymouri]|eukprot:KPI86312.1 hypothetical protein ABL78_4617 [Leptomonas seymouri]
MPSLVVGHPAGRRVCTMEWRMRPLISVVLFPFPSFSYCPHDAVRAACIDAKLLLIHLFIYLFVHVMVHTQTHTHTQTDTHRRECGRFLAPLSLNIHGTGAGIAGLVDVTARKQMVADLFHPLPFGCFHAAVYQIPNCAFLLFLGVYGFPWLPVYCLATTAGR